MMPWRLYRYILGELLKQVLLTTMILVTIIAFGAVIKPLAGDTILTPAQAIKFVGLAMIPMLATIPMDGAQTAAAHCGSQSAR